MNWNGIFSLLVACIEFVLFINLLIFAEKNKVNKMIMTLVALLTIYQTLEFLMCNIGLKYSLIAYLAFADISILPPLNLLFNFRYFNYNKKLLRLIFIPSLFFIIYYPFIIEKFAVVNCTVLYASYNYPLGTLFGLFYYLPIILSMIFLFFNKNKLSDIKKVKLINILLYGELFISIPVIIAFILSAFNSYSLLSSIESIMCKFAFVFAICLVYFVLNNKKAFNE
jgi:hypothetical protein